MDRKPRASAPGAAATCAPCTTRADRLVLWGVVALRIAQPIVLLKLSANVAGSGLHHCVVAPAVREYPPPAAARASADVAACFSVVMALFYGTFVTLSLRSMW